MLHFWNLDRIFNILKMTLIAFVFRNYGLGKTWLDKCLKRPVFEQPSATNMVKDPKHCRNLNDRSFIIFFITLKEIELGNVSLSDMWNVRNVPNTLTPHGKLSFCNSQNLLQPIQIQLSQKQETCSQCFAKFLKFTWNFEHFEKKDDPHRSCIYESKNWERPG